MSDMYEVQCPWCGGKVDYAPGKIDYENPVFQCVDCEKKFKIIEVRTDGNNENR